MSSSTEDAGATQDGQDPFLLPECCELSIGQQLFKKKSLCSGQSRRQDLGQQLFSDGRRGKWDHAETMKAHRQLAQWHTNVASPFKTH